MLFLHWQCWYPCFQSSSPSGSMWMWEKTVEGPAACIFPLFWSLLKGLQKVHFNKLCLSPISDTTASTVFLTLQMLWYKWRYMEMPFCPLSTGKQWSSISAAKVILVHSPSLAWIWSHKFTFISGSFSHLTNSISEFIQSSISMCCSLSVILWSVRDIYRNVPPESLAGYKPFKNTFSGEHKWLKITQECNMQGEWFLSPQTSVHCKIFFLSPET